MSLLYYHILIFRGCTPWPPDPITDVPATSETLTTTAVPTHFPTTATEKMEDNSHSKHRFMWSSSECLSVCLSLVCSYPREKSNYLWFSCNNLGYLFCKNFNIRCKQIHDVIFRFILSIKLKVFEPLKLYSCLKIKLINLNNRIFSSTIWLFHWHLF